MNGRLTMGLLFLLVSACGDDGATDGGPGDSGGSDAGGNDAGGVDAARDGGGTDGGGPSLRSVARFDAAMFELPEGVAIRGGNAYVSIAPTGAILEIDGTGAEVAYGSVPAPAPNMGFVLGLAFGAGGELYVGVGSFDPAVETGIYRVPAGGGAGTLFASDPAMVFPNGLAVQAGGELYVSDSGAGTIFVVSADGSAVTPWASGPLLAGDMTPDCGMTGVPFAIGTNGIVDEGTSVVIANTDQGTLVRIPVMGDGTAGTPAIAFGPDCATLFGADGIAPDGSGGYYVAVQIGSKVVQATGGEVDVLGMGGILDGPASAAVGDFGPGRALLVTSSAFASVQTPGATPMPGLVALDL